MRLAYLAVVYIPLFGQAPHPSPVIKAPGDKVTLDLSANSQPGRAPVALKWRLIFPVQLMEMDGDAEVGSAARDSGKSLQCTSHSPYSYDCTLSGGQKAITDGLIAIFHFRIRPKAEAGTATFRMDKVECTTADSKQLNLDDAETTIFIR
jgi:hypothetical protein